ncbi:hypothetical protein [Methylopila sp. 73B]|uniref:hypothetical protein n=1 Tax=Methylopila sp. 73B TaxID=1120792 RepID=UPI0003617A18|nr:hypothetical protein [Methylopila sp. 73B]
MVAYSFKAGFVPKIQTFEKLQTIRLPRKRHARPGEPVQLYQGMRTRHCEKIITDPVCVGVDEVRIDLRLLDGRAPYAVPDFSGFVVVNGIPVPDAEADAYATSDGFGPIGKTARPIVRMTRWWMLHHGVVVFDGVAIRWRPEQIGGAVDA